MHVLTQKELRANPYSRKAQQIRKLRKVYRDEMRRGNHNTICPVWPMIKLSAETPVDDYAFVEVDNSIDNIRDFSVKSVTHSVSSDEYLARIEVSQAKELSRYAR